MVPDEKKIVVIGVGPGTEEYLLPIAKTKALECDLLLGSERALALFRDFDVPQQPINGGLLEVLEGYFWVKEQQIGVVVAGDPGFYSLLSFLKKQLPVERFEVIPGISSVQYLFSRLRTPWQEYHLCSFHGRDEGDVQRLLAQYGALALLTDGKRHPGQICQNLLESSYADYRVIVGENLSYRDEKITIGTVRKIATLDKFQMSVMVIDNEW